MEDEIRSLYVSEAAVEAAILAAVGPGPFRRLIDLGTGAGRMLTLLAPRAESAIGLDLSHHMLNIARLHGVEAGLKNIELRHGDIFATGLPGAGADLVVVHRVLHYLSIAGAGGDGGGALGAGGRLLIVDFAPHELEYLRQAHQHRRLGFSDEEMGRWLEAAGLSHETQRPAAGGRRRHAFTVENLDRRQGPRPRRRSAPRLFSSPARGAGDKLTPGFRAVPGLVSPSQKRLALSKKPAWRPGGAGGLETPATFGA